MLNSDIVRRVRVASGDEAMLQYSNETLTDWINDAVTECVNENSLLQAKATSNTVIAQQDYVLPADIFKIHSVYVDGIKIPVLSLGEWEDRSYMVPNTGTPTASMIYAGVLSLYPTPDRAVPMVINYTKTIVAITYTTGPPTWTPTTPGIPSAFHSRIVLYCLAQIAQQDDDYEKYQAYMTAFTTGVNDLKHLKDETENLHPYMHFIDRDLEQYYG